MKNVLTVFAFIVSCFITNPLSALEGNKDMTLLLPVNHLTDKKVTLSVNIDKSYKTLGQLPATFMEFIPQGGSENNWSEILTVQTLVGVRASAADFLGKLKTAMKEKATTFKLLQEDSKDMKTYTMSSFGAVYETGGRKEVVYMRYYSGPADLCGVQYAKVLKAGESVEKVLQGLDDYVGKISVIVDQ